MKKLFKDLSIFRKLLYSYLAILLVSVVAMVLFTNTYFIGTIKEELISRNEETLSNLKSNMDMNISCLLYTTRGYCSGNEGNRGRGRKNKR